MFQNNPPEPGQFPYWRSYTTFILSGLSPPPCHLHYWNLFSSVLDLNGFCSSFKTQFKILHAASSQDLIRLPSFSFLCVNGQSGIFRRYISVLSFPTKFENRWEKWRLKYDLYDKKRLNWKLWAKAEGSLTSITSAQSWTITPYSLADGCLGPMLPVGRQIGQDKTRRRRLNSFT